MESLKDCLPSDLKPYEFQVGGHGWEDTGIGLLRYKTECIMKPVFKKLGEKEMNFYENLQNSKEEKTMIELKNLVPEYFGCQKYQLNGQDIKFIILKDITYGFLKPCIMDIKIGKQTWDPEASPNKIAKEESKYIHSKKILGLSIPGFQYYDLKTNSLMKFDKDFGKVLNQVTIIEAIKAFLNASYGLNKKLVNDLLAQLVKIQKWSKHQRKFRFYSSSLLIVYDAFILNQLIVEEMKYLNPNPKNFLITKTLLEESANETISPDVEEKKPITPTFSDGNCINHSLNINKTANFEDWNDIKMIDFAHNFPCTDNIPDENYNFGIDNLVKIFEHIQKQAN